MQSMQDYPSPHSNVSEQTTSSCLSVLPGAMMSPGRPMVASPSMVPSLGGSTNSRESSRRSTEPPRNAQGVLYCSHRDCAQQPPVFSRKCEWTSVYLFSVLCHGESVLTNVIGSTWTSTIGHISAKSPNATIFVASPIQEVSSDTSVKFIVSTAGPRQAACVLTRTASAVLALGFPERRT